MGHVKILVGAQWGDEGKGKWIDILAEKVDAIARFQGGNNAGHTIYLNGQKIVLHQIPSGIFHKNKVSALTSGVVVNPFQLIEEMKKIKAYTDLDPSRFWLSARAHVISPWHVYLDGKKESESKRPIGTTKRGIGPTYAEKANRTGLRVGDFINPAKRQQWFQNLESSSEHFLTHRQNHKSDWDLFESSAEALIPFVSDAEHQLRQYIRQGKEVLLEGAQGALLDINHGTYPFVTSSETAAGGAFASLGFAPKTIDKIFGVAKAYATRVGEGPFPTELKDKVGQHLSTLGKEFGATTGRPRRCGWLDAVALRYSADVSGFDGLILNKLDILSGLDEIKVCVAYQHPEQGRLEVFPWDHEVLSQCQPIYKSFKGWHEALPERGRIQDLPTAARAYVEGLETILELAIPMVGTGVNRENALFL